MPTVERATLGIFSWSPRGGVRGDGTFRELLGVRDGDTDDSWAAFLGRIHPADRDRVGQALLAALEAGGEVRATFRVLYAGGGVREVCARCSVVDGAAGAGPLGLGVAYLSAPEATDDARATTLMDNLSTGLLTLDREWRFSYVNAEGERMLRSTTLLGRSIWEAFPEVVGTVFEDNYRRVVETGESVTFRAYYPFPLNTWYEVRLHALDDGLAVTFLDVTADHELQEHERRLARRSALLAQVSQELSRSLEVERSLATLIPLVVPALADWGLVALVEQRGQDWRDNLRPVAWAHSDPALAATLDEFVPMWTAQLPDSAVIGEVMRTMRPTQHVVDRDLADENTTPGPARTLLETILPGSAANIPLVTDGRVLGLLILAWRDQGPPPQEEVETAIELAERAALLIDNARLYEAQRALAADMQHSLLTDPLTGLPNRALLSERLEHAARRSRRSKLSAAVLFVDLDRFKRVNDDYGHATGDALLVAVAARLSGLVRPGDTLARVSGDEFLLLCEELKDPAEGHLLADRIVSAFREPFLVSGVTLLMSASVGVAFAEPGVDLTEELILDADAAMYQAKRAGGAGHSAIDRQRARLTRERDHLEEDLRVALRDGGLHLAYQPIVRAETGEVTGVEALLRWEHPTRGAVSALSAIAAAERSGLMVDLGAWVLERACRDRQAWLALWPDRPLDLSVNLSVRQLMAPGLLETVTGTLAAAGMDPAALVLEVTEGIFIDDSARALDVLSRLRGLGVRLALDDFGTGYSSLSYLQRFPVDIVKIDRAFVAEIDQSPRGAAFVEAIAHLAHLLDMTVTAEGVETDGQLALIRSAGCLSAQGYLLSRPVPPDALLALLQAGACLPAA